LFILLQKKKFAGVLQIFGRFAVSYKNNYLWFLASARAKQPAQHFFYYIFRF